MGPSGKQPTELQVTGPCQSLRGNRKEQQPFPAMLQEIADKRNELMTELLQEANALISYIKKNGASVGTVSHRMADFASFAILYGRFRGEEGRASSILAKLEEKQHEMLRADEPIVACLERWLATHANHGRTVNSRQLNDELSTIAFSLSIDWPYKTSNSLGQRLSHITSELKEKFKVEEHKDSSKQKLYKFWPQKADEEVARAAAA